MAYSNSFYGIGSGQQTLRSRLWSKCLAASCTKSMTHFKLVLPWKSSTSPFKNFVQKPKLLLSICLALQSLYKQLHDAGVIYADLKPSNVLIDFHSGAVKFADFDCSKLSADFCTIGGGTVSYLSPERTADPSEVSFQDDMWALGVIILETLRGASVRNALFLVTSATLESFLNESRQEACKLYIRPTRCTHGTSVSSPRIKPGRKTRFRTNRPNPFLHPVVVFPALAVITHFVVCINL